MKKRAAFLESVAIIVGTIVGAGVIGIPYVFAEAGFLTGVLTLLVIGGALIVVRLMLGEVILRTSGMHQLTGYTERYLGKWAKNIQGTVLILGIYGTLLAYMVGQGEILAALFPGGAMTWSLIFYITFSFLILQGMDVIKRSELFLTIAIFFVVVVIAVFSTPEISVSYLTGFDMTKLFVPYGVVLFACAGLVSIPEVGEVLRREGKERLLKPAVIAGGLIPIILYLVFAVLINGVTGPATTEVATIGLGEVIGPHMVIIGNIFAFFAVATGFLTIGIALQGIFRFDYAVPRPIASALVVTVPLAAFALGLRDFIWIISVVGALAVGVNGLFAVWIFWRARSHGDRTPEFVMPTGWSKLASVFLVLLFLSGFVFAFV